jgi:hypothetical protein
VAAVCCHLALQEQRVQEALNELHVLSAIAGDADGMQRAA